MLQRDLTAFLLDLFDVGEEVFALVLTLFRCIFLGEFQNTLALVLKAALAQWQNEVIELDSIFWLLVTFLGIFLSL